MPNSLSHFVASLTAYHQEEAVGLGVPELIPPLLTPSRRGERKRRLNLLFPALFQKWTYGGVATALRLFDRLRSHFDCARIVLLNQLEPEFEFEHWPGWQSERVGDSTRNVALLGDETTPLSVGPEDVFLATFWTTATWAREVVTRQSEWFPEATRRYVYFIQDYEPAFYPWSARYAHALNTYRDPDHTIAVFNSVQLAEYFRRRAMHFSDEYVYEPILNPYLLQKKRDSVGCVKERLILVYGRPSFPRNGFELVTEALKQWATIYPSAAEWSVISAGEPHKDIELGGGSILRSRGKMNLEDYADHLTRCWTGLSIMVSPHPSYPPLEMAEFGAWVVTNEFENKDLSRLAPNILSVPHFDAGHFAERLRWCCEQHRPGALGALPGLKSVFRQEESEFPFADSLVNAWRRTSAMTSA